MGIKERWRVFADRITGAKKKSTRRKKAPGGKTGARTARRLLWVFGTLFVLIGLGWLMLPLAGYYLMVDEPPERADVIVVLSGDLGERMEHGIALFHAGVADRIIVSGGPVYMETTAADLMFEHAVEREVPAACIIKEGRARDTRENALFVKELLGAYGFDSAVVVSSPYHMRRVQMVFDRAFADGDTDTRLVYSAAPSATFDPRRWWETVKGKRLVLGEITRVFIMRLPVPGAWYGYGDAPAE